MAHDDPSIVILNLDGERIETTPEHPFFTAKQGWVAAGELTTDMHIRKVDGTYGQVREVVTEQHAQTMYNLTVAVAHTFFVGNGQWLVHNKCEKFERYGNEEEANTSKDPINKLQPKPAPHHRNPKWIGDPGTIDYRTLGSRKNYTHKLDIQATIGTRAWMKQEGFETKNVPGVDETEPGRYEIPIDRLDEFNDRVIKITATRIPGR
jgi:hypothetical protein